MNLSSTQRCSKYKEDTLYTSAIRKYESLKRSNDTLFRNNEFLRAFFHCIAIQSDSLGLAIGWVQCDYNRKRWKWIQRFCNAMHVGSGEPRPLHPPVRRFDSRVRELPAGVRDLGVLSVRGDVRGDPSGCPGNGTCALFQLFHEDGRGLARSNTPS